MITRTAGMTSELVTSQWRHRSRAASRDNDCIPTRKSRTSSKFEWICRENFPF